MRQGKRDGGLGRVGRRNISEWDGGWPVRWRMITGKNRGALQCRGSKGEEWLSIPQNFPATTPNRKCTSSPLSPWWSEEGGGCSDFPFACLLMNEKRNKMVKNSLNKSINLLWAFIQWGHSLVFENVYCCSPKSSWANPECIATNSNMVEVWEMLVIYIVICVRNLFLLMFGIVC